MIHTRLKLALILVVLLASTLTISAQKPKTELIVVRINWQQFESVDGGFSVRFPAAPKIGKIPFTKGPITFMRNTHEAAWGDYFFEVDYWDISSDSEDPDLLVEGAISGMIRAMEVKGGRLLIKKTITKGNCQGREAQMAIPIPSRGKEGFAIGRVFTSGTRAYGIIFVSLSDDQTSRSDSQTFLDSFTVTRGCPTPVAPVTHAGATTKTTIAGQADPKTGWRRIESAQHGFSALMPGAAQLEVEVTQTKPFKITHYTFAHEHDNGMFSVEVLGEYPPGFHSTPESMKTLLDITTYAMQRNLEPAGFVVVPTREVKLGTFPGKEFDLSFGKSGKGRARVFVTPKRVYIAVSVSIKPNAPLADVDQFFSALQIKP